MAPGKVIIPNLIFMEDAEAAKNFWKYNYFYKPGVSFAVAFEDFRECRLRSRISGLGLLKDFVPYGQSGAGPTARAQLSTPYRLVGGVIAGAAIDSMMERNRRFNMRECMGFKGYRQYGLTKKIWSQINPDNPILGDAIQAKIASGVQPATEALQ
jgi:hypothetical protein